MCLYWLVITIYAWAVQVRIYKMKISRPRETRGRTKIHFRRWYANCATSLQFWIRPVRRNCWRWTIRRRLTRRRIMFIILKISNKMTIQTIIKCIHNRNFNLCNFKIILSSNQDLCHKVRDMAGADLHQRMVDSPATISADPGLAMAAILKFKVRPQTPAASISRYRRGLLHSTQCAAVLRNLDWVHRARLDLSWWAAEVHHAHSIQRNTFPIFVSPAIVLQYVPSVSSTVSIKDIRYKHWERHILRYRSNLRNWYIMSAKRLKSCKCMRTSLKARKETSIRRIRVWNIRSQANLKSWDRGLISKSEKFSKGWMIRLWEANPK